MSHLLWVVLVSSAALSGYFALISYSLRAYRRVQLDAVFNTAAARKRLEAIERRWGQFRLTASFCRALANIILVVAMLYMFDAPAGGLVRVIAATAVAAGIIPVFGVAIPHAWASYAGERVMARSLGVLTFCRYLF